MELKHILTGTMLLMASILFGQVIETRQDIPSGTDHTERFDLSQQGKGIYWVVVSNAKTKSVGKIVVQ